MTVSPITLDETSLSPNPLISLLICSISVSKSSSLTGLFSKEREIPSLSLISSNKNQALFAAHGTIVCLGMILYAIASKNIPAAELTLLSLTEVIGGIFWVWLPWLGINEIPATNTIVGGFLIFLAIFYYSLIIKTNRRFIALN